MSYDFDLFVIGGGSGGIATARRAAEYGAKVGLAEYNRLGGTCVNRGCVPKKLMVYASRFPDLFEESQGYGWSPVESHLNWEKMITAVNNEVDRLNGIYLRMLDNSKVQLFRNYARFLDPHTLEVGDTKITADKILIAVGGYPVKPDIPGIEHTIVSDGMFHLQHQPKEMVIIGGGYIGVEFSCIMHGLGTKVTQIIRADKILRGFDDDIRTTIQDAMEAHGIRIIKNSEPTAIEKTPEGLKLHVKENEETSEVIVCDTISLAATGRKPNLDNLQIDKAGVTVEKEAIAVNEHSQTSQPNIYAVGDCTDRINLTPVAISEGRAFADTVFGGKPRLMSHENVPSAVFSTPEAATVGLTETEAKQKYGEDAIHIYRAKFRPMYYTLTNKDEKTLMKLVVEKASDRVLGAHMVGEHAAELIQGVAIAVKMGAKKSDFDATVGIHPTAGEEFVTMR
ncbi:glutathione-disulfide reductase [Gloeothece citriformis PCC 7424]|uniref:Glutathione reductase n=1 Tax=Gloeothece citriformis (strain PCC 7424) TaxID=65393 RepID=B7K700_GLOC7|nr:glutathione-disulfide reductase [Gloeothece citriformis]ACK72699.1 glutathione-disulfide reductase [Gloeothece citriformis PCC 7424]